MRVKKTLTYLEYNEKHPGESILKITLLFAPLVPPNRFYLAFS